MTDNIVPQYPRDFSKRYWLFSWTVFQSSGGMRDFYASFDTLEEAQAKYEALHSFLSLTRGMIFDSMEHISWGKPIMGNWQIE